MNTHHCREILTPPLPDRALEGDERQLIADLTADLPRANETIEEIVLGNKFIGVVAGGRMGLSSLLGSVAKPGEAEAISAQIGGPVSGLIELAASPSPYSLAVGLAAINAANSPDPATAVESSAPTEDLIAELGKDKVVGLVGEFPFVDQLAPRVGTFHLFELNDVPGALPRDQWETMLPKLDVLALTATTLLTRHAAWYLKRATRAKIVMLGPTTPMHPALFNWGADYLCGSVVTDVDRVRASLMSGNCFRSIKQNGGICFVQWAKEE